MTSSEITVIISAISVAATAIGAIVGIIGARRNARKEYAADSAERAKLAEGIRYLTNNVTKIDEKIDHMTENQAELAKELAKTTTLTNSLTRRVEILEGRNS